MFYNSWVAFFSETYLFLAVCAGLNIHHLSWNNYGEYVNSIISIIISTMLICIPFFTFLFYTKSSNYDKIINRD